MTQAANHIIRREVFELSTGNSKEGFECQQKAGDYIHRLINPQLELCFESLQLGDRHLVIDRLEIDLGNFSVENLEKELASRLRELLDKKLRGYMQSARITGGKVSEVAGNNKDTGVTGNRKDTGVSAGKTGTTSSSTTKDISFITGENDTSVQLLNHTEAFYTTLYYFLQHGRLPWWFEKPELLFDTALITTLQEREIHSLKEILRSSPAARMRLVNHFNTTWITVLLEHISMDGTKAAEQWQLLLPALKEFTAVEKIFHQYFWMAWIEGQTINITLLIEQSARGYNDTAIALAKAIHRTINNNSNSDHNIVPAGYKEQIEKYLDHKMPYDDFRKQVLIQTPGIGTPNVFTETTANEQQIHNTTKSPDEEIDGLFVSAAGLVIIHPFLTELFTATGLWQGKEWQDENSVYRALQMLSQLAYGETGLPEYQLPFLKILLDIDIDAPLPAQEPLTDTDKQTCADLLLAVISHWTALRNTGPAALQEGFLQRQGKLVQNKKGYHLTVERLAQDILLSRLPWGYSMIKLPWMNDMLHVTWL